MYSFPDQIEFEFVAENPLYSSPIKVGDNVICVDTKGEGYLMNKKGVFKFSVEGEVFSSIVGFDGWFVVGSRDDNLYCFDLT